MVISGLFNHDRNTFKGKERGNEKVLIDVDDRKAVANDSNKYSIQYTVK